MAKPTDSTQTKATGTRASRRGKAAEDPATLLANITDPKLKKQLASSGLIHDVEGVRKERDELARQAGNRDGWWEDPNGAPGAIIRPGRSTRAPSDDGVDEEPPNALSELKKYQKRKSQQTEEQEDDEQGEESATGASVPPPREPSASKKTSTRSKPPAIEVGSKNESTRARKPPTGHAKPSSKRGQTQATEGSIGLSDEDLIEEDEMIDLSNENQPDPDVPIDAGEGEEEPPVDGGGKKGGRKDGKKRSRAKDGPTKPSGEPSGKRRKTTLRGDHVPGSEPDDDDNNNTGGGGGDDNPCEPIELKHPPRPRGPPQNADEKFLFDALRQYAEAEPKRECLRRAQILEVFPVLDSANLTQPQPDRIQRFATIPAEEDGDEPDCYILNSVEAKQLMESDVWIKAPVFVTDGARQGLFTDSIEEPVKQFLRTWLLDPHEHPNAKISSRADPGRKTKGVAELRKHFTREPFERTHPWNLTDIHNPRSDDCRPPFIQGLNCNLLRDVMRRVMDAEDDEVCPEECEDAFTDKLGCSNKMHRLTRKEFHMFQGVWELWQGTVMLADPGAVTEPHIDNYGMGTWISVYQGEVGLAWRSHPEPEHREDVISEKCEQITRGKSLYRVVRPGETVYMPSGTIHTVFRRPSGRYTLACSGHVLRRSAMDQWLMILLEQTAFANSNGNKKKRIQSPDFEHIIPPLAEAVVKILEEGRRWATAALGGADKVLNTLLPEAKRLQDAGNQLRIKAVKFRPKPLPEEPQSATTNNSERDM